MTDQKLRMGDLTARFGVTRWTVHRWIRELGFPPGVSYPSSKGKEWEPAEIDAWARSNLLPGLMDDGSTASTLR